MNDVEMLFLDGQHRAGERVVRENGVFELRTIISRANPTRAEVRQLRMAQSTEVWTAVPVVPRLQEHLQRASLLFARTEPEELQAYVIGRPPGFRLELTGVAQSFDGGEYPCIYPRDRTWVAGNPIGVLIDDHPTLPRVLAWETDSLAGAAIIAFVEAFESIAGGDAPESQ